MTKIVMKQYAKDGYLADIYDWAYLENNYRVSFDRYDHNHNKYVVHLLMKDHRFCKLTYNTANRFFVRIEPEQDI